MMRLEKKFPRVVAVHDRVTKRPRIAAMGGYGAESGSIKKLDSDPHLAFPHSEASKLGGDGGCGRRKPKAVANATGG